MIDMIWKNYYDVKKINFENMTEVWDHKTNNPDSVMYSGVPGLHVYVLETGEVMGVVTKP